MPVCTKVAKTPSTEASADDLRADILHLSGAVEAERACDIARENGYTAINVISAIGTRGYYRKQGFADNGLYQQRSL